MYIWVAYFWIRKWTYHSVLLFNFKSFCKGMKRLQLIISALMGDSWVWFALSVDCTCGKMEWISFLPQSTEEKKNHTRKPCAWHYFKECLLLQFCCYWFDNCLCHCQGKQKQIWRCFYLISFLALSWGSRALNSCVWPLTLACEKCGA